MIKEKIQELVNLGVPVILENFMPFLGVSPKIPFILLFSDDVYSIARR